MVSADSMMKKEVILVTGASGFVGSHIVRRLVKNKNYKVHIIHRKTSDLWRIQEVYSQVKTHICDITKEIEVKEVVKKISPTIVIHLANEGLYGGEEANAQSVINVNVTGTINLILACDAIEYKCFINTGSSSEYGPKKKSMVENDICLPKSAYAVSKLASTLFAQAYAEKTGKPIVTLRLFSPFGPYDDKRRLIPTVIKHALSGRSLLLGNPTHVRDYIFVDDAVDAYLVCIPKANKLTGEIINIGRGQQQSVSDIVKNVFEITKAKSKISWNSAVPLHFESKVWEADIGKAKKLLNWEPRHTLTSGLKSTIDWYRTQMR